MPFEFIAVEITETTNPNYNHEHFSRKFKERCDASPKEYRYRFTSPAP